VDAIVETRVYEYHFESREGTVMTKLDLLNLGEKYETQIAADIQAQAKYR
jgi:NADH-quinone oxidoreductase subunit I